MGLPLRNDVLASSNAARLPVGKTDDVLSSTSSLPVKEQGFSRRVNKKYFFVAILLVVLLATVWFTLARRVSYISPEKKINTFVSKPFVDVSPNNKNFAAIKYLWREGVLEGDNNNLFHPESIMTRAEWAQLLVKLVGVKPDPDVYRNCFADVRQESFASAICYSKERGWMKSSLSKTSMAPRSLLSTSIALAIDENAIESFEPEQPVKDKEAVGSLSRSMSWTPEGELAGGGADEKAVDFAKKANIYTGAAEETITHEEAAGLVFRSVATVSFGQETYDPKLDKAVQLRQLDQLIDQRKQEKAVEKEKAHQEFVRLRDSYIDYYTYSVGRKAATEIVDTSYTEDDALVKVRKTRYSQMLETEKAAGEEALPFNALLPLQNFFASKGGRLAAEDVFLYKKDPAKNYEEEETTNPIFKPRENAQMYVFLDEDYRVIPKADWGRQKIQYFVDIHLTTYYFGGRFSGDRWIDDQQGVGLVNIILGNWETGVALAAGSSAPRLSHDILRSPLTVSSLGEIYKKALADIEKRIGAEVGPPPRERGESGYKPIIPPSATRQSETTETTRFTPGKAISQADKDAIMEKPGCLSWVDRPDVGLYCFDTESAISALSKVNPEDPLSVLKTMPPTYPYIGAKPWEAPKATEPEKPSDTSGDAVKTGEKDFERWLKECYSQPVPETRAELAEYERQMQDPSHICYNPNFKPCQKAANGTCIPGSSY